MSVKVFSEKNEIIIRPVDKDMSSFDELKFEIGFDLIFVKEESKSFRFSHLDFFINQPFYISLFRQKKVEYDESFKSFISSLTKSMFSKGVSVVDEEELISCLNLYFKRRLKAFQFKNVLKLVQRNSGATFSVPGAGKTSEILSVYS